MRGIPVFSGHGATGGVLLHIIDSKAALKDNLCVRYFYFDIFYAGAVAAGLWEPSNFSKIQAQELLWKILEGAPDERIEVPFNFFLPIKSPASIIALRFHIPDPCNYVSLIKSSTKLSGEEKDTECFKFIWKQSIIPWIDI